MAGESKDPKEKKAVPPPNFAGVQGWKQVHNQRKELLDHFDAAKAQSKGHEVETWHGVVAEAEFRKWLTGFLPKRYGVSPGYIISQGASEEEKFPHYDVIIFDALEAPTLWIEHSPDASPNALSRALPAEYVRGVIEVKASLNSTSAKKAVTHLEDLRPLLHGADAPGERYKKFLPPNFFSLALFFDLLKKEEFSEAAIDNLIPEKILRGYAGGSVLRGEGHKEAFTGRIRLLSSEAPIVSTMKEKKDSLISGSPLANSKEIAKDAHLGAMLDWSMAGFAAFAFDLIALLNGTFDPGRASSFHGMVWLNPKRPS